MSKKSGDRRPYLPPVTRIELSEKNIKLRWILLAVLLAVAAVSIFMGVQYALNTEPGWQEVEAASSEINCSRDFVFLYECGSSGLNASAEYKSVTALYTQLTESAYRIFSAEAEITSQDYNLRYLNSHVNETVQVNRDLYKALELIYAYDSRYPFLAPVVKEYAAVFLSTNDAEAALYDPNYNEEKMGYVQQSLAYAADPDMIRLELFEDNQVCLRVSEEYLSYAQENEITVFLDFGWMKNAFIVDYIAQSLKDNGYTNGSIVSYDGFTRNLDTRGLEYAYNLFDRWKNTISIPGELRYDDSMSIVFLRNYPLSEEDQWNYYAYQNGQVTSVYLDLLDGVSRSSTDNLVSYSPEYGCAEILMQTAPIFLTETFDQEQVKALEGEGIHAIWAEENVLYYTQKDGKLNLLPDSGGADYQLRFAE